MPFPIVLPLRCQRFVYFFIFYFQFDILFIPFNLFRDVIAHKIKDYQRWPHLLMKWNQKLQLPNYMQTFREHGRNVLGMMRCEKKLLVDRRRIFHLRKDKVYCQVELKANGYDIVDEIDIDRTTRTNTNPQHT